MKRGKVRWMTFREHRSFMWTEEWEQIAKYVKTSSDALQKLAEAAARRRDIRTAEDPDSADWYFEEWAEVGLDLEDHFPSFHSAATFITIYSHFEHQLFELCKMLQKKRKLGLSANDLGGKGIEQCKTYLEKGFGYKFPSATREWQEIKNLQRIRNIMAHRRGQLTPSSPLKYSATCVRDA